MDEILSQLTASLGSHPGQTEVGAGALLNLIREHASQGDFDQLLKAVPEAAQWMGKASSVAAAPQIDSGPRRARRRPLRRDRGGDRQPHRQLDRRRRRPPVGARALGAQPRDAHRAGAPAPRAPRAARRLGPPPADRRLGPDAQRLPRRRRPGHGAQAAGRYRRAATPAGSSARSASGEDVQQLAPAQASTLRSASAACDLIPYPSPKGEGGRLRRGPRQALPLL